MFTTWKVCLLSSIKISLSQAGEIWIDTRILPCGCACLEGKDHRGRLDIDCMCSNIYLWNQTFKLRTDPASVDKQKLLRLAKKLKLKYSKENV